MINFWIYLRSRYWSFPRMLDRLVWRLMRGVAFATLSTLFLALWAGGLRGARAATTESASPTRTELAPIIVPIALQPSLKAAYVDEATITSYLSDLITWHRGLASARQLVDHPEETLFFATDQQIGKEVLNLGFQAARAQATLNSAANPAGSAKSVPPAVLAGLEANARDAQ